MQKGMHQRENLDDAGWPLVAVAIDKDKTSESVFRWALENIVTRGQTLIIIHVNTKSSLDSTANNALREIFIPYRCFCSRKDVHCKDIVLEDPDVAKAIVEFVSQSSIEKLVIGESPKGGFYGPFRNIDLSSSISKAVPDFCTVIVISKGKVSSARSAVRSAPPPLRPQIPIQAAPKPEIPNNIPRNVMKVPNETTSTPWNLHKEVESIKSPFTIGGNISSTRSYENALSNSQTIMVEEEMRQLKLELKQTMDMYNLACKEAITAKQKEKEHRMREAQVAEKVAPTLVETEIRHKSVGAHSSFDNGYSSISYNIASSNSQTTMVEEEIRRLKLELKQTMDMYNSACKEAITAMQKAKELQRWKMEEEQRMREARVEEEITLALAETEEKAKCVAVVQNAEASKRICFST